MFPSNKVITTTQSKDTQYKLARSRLSDSKDDA